MHKIIAVSKKEFFEDYEPDNEYQMYMMRINSKLGLFEENEEDDLDTQIDLNDMADDFFDFYFAHPNLMIGEQENFFLGYFYDATDDEEGNDNYVYQDYLNKVLK